MIHALALTGPTASGKTALSLLLAMKLGCEIISCDSMQIYRGMDIGTAKATAEERALFPHHMLDVIDPSESYSAQRYRDDALACAERIVERGSLPLFVGGTGLYIDTLTRAMLPEVPESSPKYREILLTIGSTEQGARELHERLKEIDPESAAAIHKNNIKRVVRALEIYNKTGKPKSYFDKLSRECAQDISIGMITLDFHDRATLYARVDARVDAMIEEGLIEETRRLLSQGFAETATASQAIGYKELFAYIRGEESLDAAKERLKLATRRYAKRQLTWFRHNTDAERIYLDGEDGVMKSADAICIEVMEAALRLLDKMQIM